MGSKIYDYLTESMLFDDSLVRDEFKNVEEHELKTELRRYREFCLTNMPALEQEVLGNDSNLKLFSGVEEPKLDLLKQSAFYVEQYVMPDPLFDMTYESDEHKLVMSKLFGLRDSSFNRKRLSKVISYLKSLTPMIVVDYVKLLPTSYFSEPPEQLPFRHSESGFADILPEALMQFLRANAIVESVKNVGGFMRIDGSFEIGRGIHVRFKDHGFEDARGYQLAEQEVVSVEEENRKVNFRMSMPDAPPDPALFERWVFQSINQTAGHLYDRVLLENTLATRFGASYLTKSPLLFKLLEQFVPTEETVQTNTINALLNVELPFLDRVDVQTLMKIRVDDGEAFQTFRLELDKQLRDLRLVKDPEQLRVKTENAVHDLSEVQVNQINLKVKQLRGQLATETIVAAGGLLGAIQSGGFSLLVSALAAFKGYKSYGEYLSQKKQNPAFFLWKVLRK